MSTRPSGKHLLAVFLLWATALLVATQQATGPVPAKDWTVGDLLTARGWVQPMGFNTARGRTVVVNSSELLSVYFVNGRQGWAVGEGGTILTTQNAGMSWQPQASGTQAQLFAVTFTSPAHGWAVGEGGTILTTLNGGQTWQQQTSGTSALLFNVKFTTSTQGWAVGADGTILATQNAGLSWQAQASGTQAMLTSVAFTSSTQGWAVGSGGTILATQNAGLSWQAQASGTQAMLTSVAFASPTQGWVVGEGGTILATQNGGQSWQAQASGSTAYLTGVSFTSPAQGWVVGEGGTILVTQNGGQSWQVQTSDTKARLLNVVFASPTQGWTVGSGGTILSTQNAGQSWQAQTSGTYDWFNDVAFTSPTAGWSVGGGGSILSTQNAGQSWQRLNSGTSAWLNAVTFTSPTQGWAVGEGGTILATQNAGQSWQQQRSGTTEWLYDVVFVSPIQGWVVGWNGSVLTTHNAGQSWQAQHSGTPATLTRVTFISPSQGWAVGAGGTILTTQNAGQSWQSQQSGTTVWLNAVTFTSPTQGWVVGESGTILVTQNGGQSWQVQASGTKARLMNVAFTSPTQGWAVGIGGTILTTQNGGQSWQAQHSGTQATLAGMAFISSALGWVSGSGGTLLTTQNAGAYWQNINPITAFWRDTAFGTNAYWLWPSPAALLACSVLLLVLAARFARHVQHQRKTAQAGGIHDAPIEDLQSDRLQRAPLVRSLARLFRNLSTRPPLAVALCAPWGVGKSSVLGMLRDELKGHAHCVYINPWHYPQDSQLLAALMTGICTQAVPPLLSFANVRFRLNLLWQRVLVPHKRWLWVLLAVLVFALWPAGSDVGQFKHALFQDARWQTMVQSLAQTARNVQAILPPTLQAWAGDGVQAMAVLLGVLLLWHKGLKRLYTFSPSLTRALAHSAQWAAKSMGLPDWSQHAGLRQQFAQDFRDIAQAFGTERLVLLIDDLDRCEPTQVAQTLATLNFVFTNQAPCFVVLAMDKHYVLHALGLAYKDMALAMHGEASALSSGGDATPPSQNGAQLAFAQNYLRKLVQLDISLTHDTDQGALMVLDDLPKPARQANASAGMGAGVIAWVRARWRYHQQSIRALWPAAKHATIDWGGLFLKLWRFLAASYGVLGKWLQSGFNAVLDARRHHWASLGNAFFLFISSYVLAVLLTGVFAIVAPALVPKSVPDTTVAAVTTASPLAAANGKAREAGNAAQTPNPANNPERERAGGGAAQLLQPNANTAMSWWPSINLLAVMILMVAIAIRAAQTVRDSEAFLLAVQHWHPVLSPRFPNPREWKRLSNMARFLAMRVLQEGLELSRSQRLAQWWQAQGVWAQEVLQSPAGQRLPRPGARLEAAQPFALSEGAAVELWMLSCLSKGHFQTALRAAIDAEGELASKPKDFLFSAWLADDPEQAENLHAVHTWSAKLIEDHPGIPKNEDPDQGMRYQLLKVDGLIMNSSGLQMLLQKWKDAPSAVVPALRQWLAWTHDLRMDIAEEGHRNQPHRD
jgi:photosystem II stability/assembly factor-like uncharacterized protein